MKRRDILRLVAGALLVQAFTILDLELLARLHLLTRIWPALVNGSAVWVLAGGLVLDGYLVRKTWRMVRDLRRRREAA